MAQQVVLGSGDLYIVEYTDGVLPDAAAIEVAGNKIGSIKGGATLTVEPEVYEVIDDKGICLKRFITSQEIVLKSGILTWDLETLKKLTLGGELTQGAETNTLKIGTAGEIAKYVVHFVHTGDGGKKVRLTIVGTASNGFELNFKPDEETVIDAEFKAMAMDAAGNQVIIEQEV